MIFPEREVWALYRSVSELLLSPKEGWRRMKWKLYAEVQRPEKRASSWEEGLSSLPEGEWAVAESQRGMTQDEVKNCMPRCNALKNGYPPEKKSWVLYRRMSELLLSPKEGWRRVKWKLYAKVERPEKPASSWEEGLSSLPEGEWAGAESQRGMAQGTRRMTARQTKKIEKEGINIMFRTT